MVIIVFNLYTSKSRNVQRSCIQFKMPQLIIIVLRRREIYALFNPDRKNTYLLIIIHFLCWISSHFIFHSNRIHLVLKAFLSELRMDLLFRCCTLRQGKIPPSFQLFLNIPNALFSVSFHLKLKAFSIRSFPQRDVKASITLAELWVQTTYEEGNVHIY